MNVYHILIVVKIFTWIFWISVFFGVFMDNPYAIGAAFVVMLKVFPSIVRGLYYLTNEV